jgi:hypothetical protein
MTEQSANPEVHSLEDLAGDLARAHRATGGDRGVKPSQVQADLAALERDGYVILTGLLSRNECDDLRAELTPLLGRTGRNAHLHRRTFRQAHGRAPAAAELCAHPEPLRGRTFTRRRLGDDPAEQRRELGTVPRAG